MEVTEDRICICGWPTDTLSIDHTAGAIRSKPHTLLLFIPGNPGVVHWYVDFLYKIVDYLGEGYAVRGVSYAGHGVGEEVVGTDSDHEIITLDDVKEQTRREDKMNTAWTMDGQVLHKVEWIDVVLLDFKRNHLNQDNSSPNLIFISHSIGAHLVQCLLLERPDILARTQQIIHLMPFFRFDPPWMNKTMLSTVANNHKLAIPMATTAVRVASSTLSRKFIDTCMKHIAGVICDKGRRIALDVFSSPNMVRNHLILGTQEVRELPESPNDIALRLIGESCPASILFCDPDQWAPLFHMEDLQRLQTKSKIPRNITMQYLTDLRHDFVVRPEMIDPVAQFCIRIIKKRSTTSKSEEAENEMKLVSKL